MRYGLKDVNVVIAFHRVIKLLFKLLLVPGLSGARRLFGQPSPRLRRAAFAKATAMAGLHPITETGLPAVALAKAGAGEGNRILVYQDIAKLQSSVTYDVFCLR